MLLQPQVQIYECVNKKKKRKERTKDVIKQTNKNNLAMAEYSFFFFLIVS